MIWVHFSFDSRHLLEKRRLSFKPNRQNHRNLIVWDAPVQVGEKNLALFVFLDENFAILKTYGWTSARRRLNGFGFQTHNTHILFLAAYSFSRLHTSLDAWIAFSSAVCCFHLKHFSFVDCERGKKCSWKPMKEQTLLRPNNVEWLFFGWDALSTLLYSLRLIPHHDFRPRFLEIILNGRKKKVDFIVTEELLVSLRRINMVKCAVMKSALDNRLKYFMKLLNQRSFLNGKLNLLFLLCFFVSKS